MSDAEFSSNDACAAEVHRLLSGPLPFQGDALDALASKIAEQFEQPPTPLPKGVFGLILRQWVIRDDDFKLIEELSKALLAAAGATFFLDAARTPAASVGLAVAAFSILRNAWRHSARLTVDDLTVLWVVKGEYPQRPSTDTLLFLLRGAVREDGPWTLPDLEKALARLQQYPVASGLKRFIAQDSFGGWGVEGV